MLQKRKKPPTIGRLLVFRNEEFFVLARKSKDCEEAYHFGTPHK